MKTRITLALISLFFLCNNAPNQVVVARINSQKITLDDMNQRVKSFPVEYQLQLQTQEYRAALLNKMIDENLLIADAKKQGVADLAAFEKELIEADKKDLESDFNQSTLVQTPRNNAARNGVISGNLLKEKIEVSERDVREAQRKVTKNIEMRKASLILVREEKLADQILQDLKNGANFSELAKKYSLDISAKNGGLVGIFTRGQLVPQFEKKAFGTKTITEAELAKTQFGFQITQFEAAPAKPEAEYTKSSLTRQKTQEECEKYIKNLRSKVRLKLDLSKVN